MRRCTVAETILIVDDEPVNRALLEAILTEAGYQVEQAEGGEAALAQAKAAPPDLILLDLMMPGIGGHEVCQRLKKDPTTDGVPIIVVTAFGAMGAKEWALARGAEDFVLKPVQPEDLRARVSAMLKVRGIRQDLDRTLAYLHEREAARHAQRQAVLTNVLARTPGEPSPVLTAYASSRNAIAALKLGAFDFIIKGLEHDLMLLAVHRAVRHRRETLNKKGEIEQLRARIAELERGRAGGQREVWT
jgi:CheY-like chemotaxis protein